MSPAHPSRAIRPARPWLPTGRRRRGKRTTPAVGTPNRTAETAAARRPAKRALPPDAGASAAALGLIRVFDWTLGQEAGSARTTTQVLVAGLAAMALFRSSLLNLKIGTEDVSIGPSVLLASLLVVVDRGIDRRRATQRSRSISRVMKDVSFSKAKTSLPAYCLQLMQNVPLDEQVKLRTAVEMLELAKMDEDLKALNLGLLLMNTVGPAVLDAAVRDLGARIKHELQPAPQDAPTSPAPTSPAIGVQPHPVPALAQAPDQATV